eukprot:3798428-Lingulodinium_polyedra.AAC.1
MALSHAEQKVRVVQSSNAGSLIANPVTGEVADINIADFKGIAMDAKGWGYLVPNRQMCSHGG